MSGVKYIVGKAMSDCPFPEDSLSDSPLPESLKSSAAQKSSEKPLIDGEIAHSVS